MLFRQFVDDDLGCASYLIGDEEAGEAIVVDPAYEIGQYLAAAEELGVRLTRVLETHTHADHLSGHGRLALEHGLPVAIHADAEPAYAFEPLADGDEIPVGSLRVRVIHTPGHRPEHCCFVAGDVVLTGDSLFVGAVARPDLAVEAHEGAEGLFYSLRRLLELPDACRVYPGHVAGSLCGTGMSSVPDSTIGDERRSNAALQVTVVNEFVAESAGVNAPRPPNMQRIVELNRGPFVGATQPLQALAAPGDATVLDVRPATAFTAGHVRGALNVPVSTSSFGTKAGFILRPDERIAVHASSPAEAELAARRLHAIGFLELEGYLEHADARATVEPVGIAELEQLVRGRSVQVLDVRELDERDSGYIAGSLNMPYRLVRRCADALPRERPFVTICESGARAAIAASVLQAAGLEARPVVDAGIPDWQARGNGTVHFRRCGGT